LEKILDNVFAENLELLSILTSEVQMSPMLRHHKSKMSKKYIERVQKGAQTYSKKYVNTLALCNPKRLVTDNK